MNNSAEYQTFAGSRRAAYCLKFQILLSLRVKFNSHSTTKRTMSDEIQAARHYQTALSPVTAGLHGRQRDGR
jgi:hypothetical protein